MALRQNQNASVFVLRLAARSLSALERKICSDQSLADFVFLAAFPFQTSEDMRTRHY